MASARPSIDDEVEVDSKIKTLLNTIVDGFEQKMTDAKSTSVDDAEKLLEDACSDCIRTFQTKIEDIKATARRARPNSSSPTYDEDQEKYAAYITVVAAGVEQSRNLFDKVFERIKGIVSHVLECLKAGVTCIWDQLKEAFASVKAIWRS